MVLCEGSGHHDVLFLQLKEARRSVIARHVGRFGRSYADQT
jgi:hypothetical protein